MEPPPNVMLIARTSPTKLPRDNERLFSVNIMMRSSRLSPSKMPSPQRWHEERASTATPGVKECWHTNGASQDEQQHSHRKQALASARLCTSDTACRGARPQAARLIRKRRGPKSPSDECGQIRARQLPRALVH